MIKIIRYWILLGVMWGFSMSCGWANIGDYFSVSSTGTAATIELELCLSAGGAQFNSQSNCEKLTVANLDLAIQAINLRRCGSSNQGYSNAGIKILTPGYTVSSGTTGYNRSTGYFIFSVNCSTPTTLNLQSQNASGPSITNINPTSGSAAGGTFFTITGTGLTFTTSVTFGGVAATSVTVVNDTTVTGVTPAHAVGAVDVEVSTSSGAATLASGYTYLATAVGQSAYGGKIACLGGTANSNLIAANADNSNSIVWGGSGTTTGAISDTNGAVNTETITTTLGNNSGIPYAAQLCADYNTKANGTTCSDPNASDCLYKDWFLPAKEQLGCLYNNKDAVGGFNLGYYWSSTESSLNRAWEYLFDDGFSGAFLKDDSDSVRCVRSFNP